MAKTGLFVQCVFILLLSRKVYSETTVDIVFAALSQRLNNLDRTFETRLEKAVKTINGRLDRIEKIVGINEDISENDDQVVLNGIQHGQTLWADIRDSKYQIMEAFAKEKHIMREFTTEYGHQFEKLKLDVTETLQAMNNMISESHNSMTTTMSEFQSEIRDTVPTKTNMDKLYNDAIYRIEWIEYSAHSEREIISTKLKNATDRISAAENKQGKLNSRINAADSQISSLNGEHDRDIQSVRNSISNVDSRVSSLDNEHDEDIRSVRNRISSVESRVSSLDSSTYSRIDSPCNPCMTSSHESLPKFAADVSHTLSYSKGSIVKFDNVFVGDGSVYSKHTGKFTAPKSGTYLLSFSIEGTKENWAAFMLMVNGYQKSSAFSAKDTYVTASQTVPVHMSKGSQAWIEAWSDSETQKYRSIFSGVFLG